MPGEKPAPPLSETLFKSAKYYAKKAGQPDIVNPSTLTEKSQGIFTMLAQADKQTHVGEYFRLLATAAVLEEDLKTKKGDLATAKFLLAQAAAAKALEAISLLYEIEPTKEEMEALLDKSGFWQYFEPANETKTDPTANQFSDFTQTK